MVELLEYTVSNGFWHFLGCYLIIFIPFAGVAKIIRSFSPECKECDE